MRKLVVFLVAVAATLAAAYFLFPEQVFRYAQRAERGAAGLSERAADVGGVHIAYLEGGSGEPLVLLHGFGGNKDHWVRVSKYLTAHYHVIAPDLPGFGESTQDTNASYGYAEQVVRVHEFLQSLSLGAPVHLGGNSMGGHIAGLYAARYPDEVKSLWLIAPGGVFSARKSELVELMEKGENPLLVDSPEAFDRLMRFVFVEPPFIPGPLKRHLAEEAVAHRAFNEKVMKDLFTAPIALESELKGREVSTLVVWGDQDRLLDVSGAAILGSVLPHSQVVVMKGVGHCPMIEKPKESAEGFLAFHQIQT